MCITSYCDDTKNVPCVTLSVCILCFLFILHISRIIVTWWDGPGRIEV